jgi:hypothetical protein
MRREETKKLKSALDADPAVLKQLVADLVARSTGGRRPIPAAEYRRLQLWWDRFYRQHKNMPLARAVAKFRQIAGAQKIKRRTAHSHLNAVARGREETARVNMRRRSKFGIRGLIPRTSRPITDPAMKAYLRAAEEYALLGTGPGCPLVHFLTP